MSDAAGSDAHRDFATLANAYLDGALDAAGRAQLEARLAADPEAACELARLALLHDALDRECTAGAALRLAAKVEAEVEAEIEPHTEVDAEADAEVDAEADAEVDSEVDARVEAAITARPRLRPAAFRRRLFVAASLLLGLGLATIFATVGREASASETLARIVEALRTGDRTYILRAIEGDGRMRRREAPLPAKRAQPPIDGAVVSLRNPSSYVLIRRDTDGREVVSGSDGATAWVVPAEGPVRVSADAARFRGALPGGRLDIPFIDPHADLSALARGYDLILQKPAPAAGRPDARLVATRRADVRGGPKRIEMDFDPKTALVRAIRLENLPQAQGGPRSVEFELIDDAPLGADYFRHTAHHAPDRPVIRED